MTTDPPDPPTPEDLGYIPPDPDEPAPVELWSAVGDIVPWGTAFLLLTWAAVFATFAVRGEFGDRQALIAWGASVTGRSGWETAWRLLASTCLHAGAAHLFFNAASMLVYGPAVERLFARGGFWVVAATGGAAASYGSVVWRAARHPSVESLSVGASGMIFALGGAILVAALRLRRRLAPSRARALGAALLFLLAQGLVSGLTRHGTDNAAHATGLAAGMLAGALLPLNARLAGPPSAATGAALRAGGVLAALALAASLAIGAWQGLNLR